jgi:hypothetical protein
LRRLRRATSHSGVLLAADMDDRFVHGFACARGRVVARRRLPRSGDAQLEAAPLRVALETALAERPRTPGAHEAEQARIVAAAFARPGLALAAVRHDVPRLAAAVAAAREQVPLRR